MTRNAIFISLIFTWPLLAGAETAIGEPAAGASPEAAVFDCSRLEGEVVRVEAAKRGAIEQGENAWKAVVPFVVLALKVSSKAAADEADKKLAELRLQAQRCAGNGPQ